MLALPNHAMLMVDRFLLLLEALSSMFNFKALIGGADPKLYFYLHQNIVNNFKDSNNVLCHALR